MEWAVSILKAALEVKHLLSLAAFLGSLVYLGYYHYKNATLSVIQALPEKDRARAALRFLKPTNLPTILVLVLGILTGFWMFLHYREPTPVTPGMAQVSIVQDGEVFKVTVVFDPLRGLDERYRLMVELAPDEKFAPILYGSRIANPEAPPASFELTPAILGATTQGTARLSVYDRDGTLRRSGGSTRFAVVRGTK